MTCVYFGWIFCFSRFGCFWCDRCCCCGCLFLFCFIRQIHHQIILKTAVGVSAREFARPFQFNHRTGAHTHTKNADAGDLDRVISLQSKRYCLSGLRQKKNAGTFNYAHCRLAACWRSFRPHSTGYGAVGPWAKQTCDLIAARLSSLRFTSNWMCFYRLFGRFMLKCKSPAIKVEVVVVVVVVEHTDTNTINPISVFRRSGSVFIVLSPLNLSSVQKSKIVAIYLRTFHSVFRLFSFTFCLIYSFVRWTLNR